MFNKPNSCIGVGINVRSETAEAIIRHIDKIDFIEINTERFFTETTNNIINQLVNSIPVVLHGLTLSIGTNNQPISTRYIQHLSDTLEKIDCAWFSEHLATTHIGDFETRSLMPVEFTMSSADAIVNKAKQLTSISNRPFLLENITYYYAMPTSHMTEIDFFTYIVEHADCGILLDLNNLYVNSVNHQYDPYKFLNQLPLDRLVEIHLAGCDYMYGMLVDTHASTIRQEVLSLFDYVSKRARVNGVVIERDANFDNFSALLNEVSLVREILKRNGHSINHEGN